MVKVIRRTIKMGDFYEYYKGEEGHIHIDSNGNVIHFGKKEVTALDLLKAYEGFCESYKFIWGKEYLGLSGALEECENTNYSNEKALIDIIEELK